MKKSNNAPRELPTGNSATTPVFRGSAAVYRSLEVPIAPVAPLDFAVRSTEKSHPSLVGPTANGKGEAFYEVKGVKAKSASSSSSPVSEKEHKPLPIPVIIANAPHHSVFVKSDPVSLVVDQVHKLFNRHSIDIDFDPAQFKWKCACYATHVETRFICRLFQVPDKSNYFVLDFQRLGGDAVHFQSIHHSINNELLKSGFVIACEQEKAKETVPIRTFKPMAMPANFFSAEDDMVEEKDAKEYEPLCQMCMSPFIDVQREGLTTLASQLEQSSAARASLVEFVDKLMYLAAHTHDVQVRRLAVSALAWATMETNKLSIKPEEMQTLVTFLLTNKKFRRLVAKLEKCL